MRVCMILEGCYPFVRGGVSAWVHQYMKHSPDIEFVLWTIHASKDHIGEALYTFPDNVKEHDMVTLDEAPVKKRHFRKKACCFREASTVIYQMLMDEHEDHCLEELISLMRDAGNMEDFLYSEEFLSLAERISDEMPGLGLADTYYSLQSMLIPICRILTSEIPAADVYHSAVAGYGGLLGAMAAILTRKPFILTEHGIYPREREEELIASDWTVPAMRSVWIRLFYKMSRFAYKHADKVTSLFENAKKRQMIIGCAPEKCVVIPNGIQTDQFDSLALPEPGETVHIGAFVRFAVIKDLKTMIRAFYAARQKREGIFLHIMGGTDDEDYRKACEALISRLGLGSSVIIEGHVNTPDYMKRMDFTILTSISEGQPLTILESMAAGRPCIATRVGDCTGLLTEDGMNGTGAAGICCMPMMTDEIAEAILTLCEDSALRKQMGENGRKRVKSRYLLNDMLRAYHALYREVN